MQKSLIINSTDVNGNAKAKSITNINPDATSEQLQEFAQRVTALTTNTYEGASVVQKYDVTEAVGGGVVGGKIVPELSIVNSSKTSNYTYGDIVYAGDGALNAFMLSDGYETRVTVAGSAITISGGSLNDIEGYIFAEETDNYAPVWMHFIYHSDMVGPEPTVPTVPPVPVTVTAN